MRTIGITGGIAAGKSTVAEILSTFPQIDADVIAREVVEPDGPGWHAVVAAFGKEMLQPDGNLDRVHLREAIANDELARQKLNNILHPLIRRKIRERLAALSESGASCAFVSAALMLETGSYHDYDAVILVSAPEHIRLERLLQRDRMDKESAQNLMRKQWRDNRKRPLATVEIINDGDRETLEKRTWQALKKLNIEQRES